VSTTFSTNSTTIKNWSLLNVSLVTMNGKLLVCWYVQHEMGVFNDIVGQNSDAISNIDGFHAGPEILDFIFCVVPNSSAPFEIERK
jgi:hypothetical protein